jgi:hypothetical protein
VNAQKTIVFGAFISQFSWYQEAFCEIRFGVCNEGRYIIELYDENHELNEIYFIRSGV